MLSFNSRTGEAMAPTASSASAMTGHGRRITTLATAGQKRAPLSRWGRTARASMRGPSTPRTAGTNVSAARTATRTTRAPPTPMERKAVALNMSRPLRPSITVTPENKTARPAWATVTATASSMGRRAISSRKRLTMSSA